MRGDLNALKTGAIVEKIKEKIIPLALIATSIYIAYVIAQGINDILIYVFSLKPSPIIGDPGYFIEKGFETFQFDLFKPLTIFLILCAFLPNLEKHSIKLRIFGAVPIFFMHFGNFMQVFGVGGDEGMLILFLFLLFVYSAPLAAFFFKDWPSMAMISLGMIYSLISLIIVYSDPSLALHPYEIRLFGSGLIVAMLGAFKVRNVPGIKTNLAIMFFIHIGLMWTLAVFSFYLFYGLAIVSQIFDFSLILY